MLSKYKYKRLRSKDSWEQMSLQKNQAFSNGRGTLRQMWWSGRNPEALWDKQRPKKHFSAFTIIGNGVDVFFLSLTNTPQWLIVCSEFDPFSPKIRGILLTIFWLWRSYWVTVIHWTSVCWGSWEHQYTQWQKRLSLFLLSFETFEADPLLFIHHGVREWVTERVYWVE